MVAAGDKTRFAKKKSATDYMAAVRIQNLKLAALLVAPVLSILGRFLSDLIGCC